MSPCLESLPNEIFHEIFDYLEGIDLLVAFSNLNNRFQTLITCLNLRMKVNPLFCSNEVVKCRSNYISMTNKESIISLDMSNTAFIDLNFKYFNIDLSFTRLQSLTLDDIKSGDLIPLLTNLISLPCLSSLNIYYDDDISEITNIYQIIFSLKTLKYNQLSFYSFESELSLPVATKQQLSNLKYLVMNHPCTLHDLSAILSYTPQLCHLIFEQVNLSNSNIVKDNIPTILSLTRIRIRECYASFNDIETFLMKVSPNLEVLRIETLDDTAYLDADRWERIISKNFLHLVTFEFKYKEKIDELYEITDHHEKLNDFNSAFWTKRKLIFEISIENEFWNENVVNYSISSCRLRK